MRSNRVSQSGFLTGNHHHTLRETVRLTAKRFKTLYVGFSGGLDSTVLLSLAASNAERDCIVAVHFNHQLCPEADHWQEHCERIANSLGVRFAAAKIGPFSGNVENAARRARYEAWSDMLNEHDAVALAHNADDDEETLLWQLFTGRAIVGIPRERSLGNGKVVRPLIGFSRSALERYALDLGLRWIEDPSNQDLSLDRNWIRHVLRPELHARFPQFRSVLATLSPANVESLASGPFALYDDNGRRRALSIELLRSWLWANGEVPSNAVLLEIAKQAFARRDAAPIVRISSSSSVRRYRSALHVVGDIPVFQQTQLRVGSEWVCECGGLTWCREAQGLPEGLSLLVRPRENGDRVQTTAGTKRLSRLFQEQSIAPWLRDTWPVLVQEKAIVSVPDIAIAPPALVSQGLIPRWKPAERLWNSSLPLRTNSSAIVVDRNGPTETDS